jgi:hypothetical protein
VTTRELGSVKAPAAVGAVLGQEPVEKSIDGKASWVRECWRTAVALAELLAQHRLGHGAIT